MISPSTQQRTVDRNMITPSTQQRTVEILDWIICWICDICQYYAPEITERNNISYNMLPFGICTSLMGGGIINWTSNINTIPYPSKDKIGQSKLELPLEMSRNAFYYFITLQWQI
jgi:hypothetical protein